MVTMKNAVFWEVASCRYCVNRCFGRTYRLHLQGIGNPLTLIPRSRISYTLKMDAIRSSETSVNAISTRRHIPEGDILQNQSVAVIVQVSIYSKLFLIQLMS
jgi:hypothetical protein